MYWFRTSLLLLLASPAWSAEGYIIGTGVEADSGDAIAATFSAELGLTKNTWLSTAVARSKVDLPRGRSIDTLYADIGIDHWFQPLGVRAGVAYWGDNEVLDSVDFRGSVYWRNDKVSVSGDFEYRDFTFDIFRGDLRPGQDAEFHAHGAGLSARFELNESVDLSFSAIDFSYDVNLRLDANRPIRDFLSVSRLSLLNSLIDYRGRVTLGVDVGLRRWSLDYATWQGEVDGGKTNSVTLRFLTPLGQKSDVEIGLGVDRSKDFGSVTLLSVFFFFYG